jgi:dissimilatory sulfite reductase (desulfoviridin) alpha/beta subunit
VQRATAQSKTGDNLTTAAGVPRGSFMHVHEAMVNVVENGLRLAHIMLKTGLGAFSEAVNGNMELKKRSTQIILPVKSSQITNHQ